MRIDAEASESLDVIFHTTHVDLLHICQTAVGRRCLVSPYSFVRSFEHSVPSLHCGNTGMLSVGTSCTVRAINARPELNGRRGVVLAEHEGGRVGVQVEGEAKPLSLKSTNLDVVGADESWAKLAMLGYHFVAGPSGDPSDLVLRQLTDKAVGFAWKGQEDYDAVGAAVTAAVQASSRARPYYHSPLITHHSPLATHGYSHARITAAYHLPCSGCSRRRCAVSRRRRCRRVSPSG